MGNKKILILALFFIFTSANIFAQAKQDSLGIVTVTTGPDYLKKYKIINIHVFNGTLVKDSIIAKRIFEDSKNFKTKVKFKNISKDIADRIGLDTEHYAYFFKCIEIKDVILDIQTMKLLKIK